MGQRHQIFIIANIAHRYRSLAAVHHQWLYGSSALNRCRDILAIFSDPENHVPIKEEIKRAESHDEEFWEISEEEDIWVGDKDQMPFPFIATCLILGASFNEDTGYVHRVSLEPWKMAYDQGDNNDGITIIDISKLDKPSYCFLDFHGMESQNEVQLMAPLSARTYLEAYHPIEEEKDRRSLEQFIDELSSYPLIKTEALESTWPDAEFNKPEAPIDREEDLVSPLQDISLKDNMPLAPLRTQAFSELADAIVHGEEIQPQVISEARRLRDFRATVKARFYKDPHGLKFNMASLDTLIECLDGESRVHLGCFASMTSDQMFETIGQLTESRSLELLNLTGSSITKGELKAFLDGNPKVRRLCLLGNDLLSPQEVAESRVTFDFQYDSLLRFPFEPAEQQWPPAPETEQSSPDFAGMNGSLIQFTWIGLSTRFLGDAKSYKGDGMIDFAMASSSRSPPAILSSNKASINFWNFALNATPLPPSRLVRGFCTFLKWLQIRELPTLVSDAYIALAGSLARGSYSQIGTSIGVGPLSKPLLNQSSTNPTPPTFEPQIKTGQWSLVLIHPCFDTESFHYDDAPTPSQILEARDRSRGGRGMDPNYFYYAMVSPLESAPEYKIVDMSHYIHEVAGDDAPILTKWWETFLRQEPRVRFWDFAGLQELLHQKIYRKD